MEEQKQEKRINEQQPNIKQKFKEAVQEVKEEINDPDQGRDVMKVVLISGAVVAVIWGSKYILLAIAGTIRAFKELRKSIAE